MLMCASLLVPIQYCLNVCKPQDSGLDISCHCWSHFMTGSDMSVHNTQQPVSFSHCPAFCAFTGYFVLLQNFL